MALATFALAVTVPSILKRFKGITGGVGGISADSVRVPAWCTLLTPERWTTIGRGVLLAFCFGVSWFVLQGRIGRSLRALRDNETPRRRSASTRKSYKTLAFAWSAGLRGIAGGILAIATAYVSPDIYGFALSLTLVIGAVLGGLDSYGEPLLGGVLVEFLAALDAEDQQRGAVGRLRRRSHRRHDRIARGDCRRIFANAQRRQASHFSLVSLLAPHALSLVLPRRHRVWSRQNQASLPRDPLGGTHPFSGPASAYGNIGKGIQAYSPT